MDDLTEFILRELAYEAGLGSDVSQLSKLISQYYSTFYPNVNQTLDDKLCAYVWSLLGTRDDVVVGCAPDGAVPVHFPPQMGSSQKGKEKAVDETAALLVPLPSSERESAPLEVLVTKYGADLRIAITPEGRFRYLTGSHVRPARLSGTVYAVLQLIARTRREGISAAEVSKQSGYSPKDCFSLLQTLVELGHIHKIRVGGSAVNICIHRAFYDDQCEWKQAQKEAMLEFKPDDSSHVDSTAASDAEDDEGKEFKGTLQFDRIDNRHLSNIQVVKPRLERLLQHAPNGIHAYRNLLFALGFDTSNKKERRVFTHRIQELIKARFTEKVWAPSKTSSTGRVLCVRLVTGDNSNPTGDMDLAEVSAGDENDPTDDAIEFESEKAAQDVLAAFEGTNATQSIAQRIIAMIEGSGTTGMTVAEISKGLHKFDLRSITNLTARFTDGDPPTHLADRGLVIRTETYGREKRQRLFTNAAYLTMIERDRLEDKAFKFTNEDLVRAGGWAKFEEDEFFANERAREEWIQDFVRRSLVDSGEKTRRGAKGKKPRKNPLDANGKPVIGRPRKEWKLSKPIEKDKDPPKKRGRPPKRKAEEVEGAAEPPVPKKRGRPPKVKPVIIAGAENEAEPGAEPDATDAEDITVEADSTSPKPATRTRTSAKTSAAGPNADVSVSQIEPTPEQQASTINDVPQPTIADSEVQPENSSEQAPKTTQERRSTRLKKQKPTELLATTSASQSLSSQVDKRLASSPRRPSKRARVVLAVESTDNQETSPDAPEDTSAFPIGAHTSSLDGLERIAEPESDSASLQPSKNRLDASPAVMAGEVAHILQANSLAASSEPRQGRPANVSSLRRQTEFLQVIETMGGVVNISHTKAFTEEHQKLLGELHVSGKVVSGMPGTGMDRRTFNSTINALELKGRLKTRVVSTVTPLGAARRANIIHLPEASPESIEACIEKFRGSTSSGKGVPMVNDYPTLPATVSSPKAVRAPANAPLRASPAPAPILMPPQDPLAIARAVHLADPMTAAQYVGYIPGRFSRARALHLRLLSELASEQLPSTLVSLAEKVFSKDYFLDSLPLSTYCAIIPLGSVFEELKDLLATETGPNIRVLDVPESIRRHLRPRSSANRSRIHKALSTLVSLGCLTPVRLELDASAQTRRYVEATSADTQWNYFKLTESVSIYRFADKDLEAPFCRDHQVPNVEAGIHLWAQLRTASQSSTWDSIQCSNSGARFSGDPKLLRAIRRSNEWESEYALSNAQSDYLYGLIDVATGHTPLDDQLSIRFDNACYTTTAPASVVSAFFSRKRADIQHDLERARKKAEERNNERRRLDEQARQALAAKAARAKKEQELRWETLVGNALEGRASSHPQLQKALASLKSAYMVTSQPVSDPAWEAKIQGAIRDSFGAKQFVISPKVSESSQNAAILRQEPEAGVSALILRQGHPIAQKDIAPKKSGRKSKKQLEAETQEASENQSSDADPRRRRFPWNPDYDELARDAGAIIRVRCHGKRMDWSALEQVFPGVQRNSVRQRISNLETLPGAAAYFRRLDDAWTTVWVQNRGTEVLPDPNPDSVKDFNLPAHVTFLRQHIDKAALRVGTEPSNTDTGRGSFMPDSLSKLHAKFIVKDLPSGTNSRQPTSWDFYFDVASEEPREREFLNHPFVLCDDALDQDQTPVNIAVAKAAIRMVISTPANAYDSNDAAGMLNNLGELTVKSAIEGMKDSLDMRKTRPDRREPGRKYEYSDLEVLRLKGDFASSMYPDAASMRENLDNLHTGEWMDIGLTDEDGEVAAFLQLVSDNKLDIGIDTLNPRVAREHLGSQSKKVDDENLEAQLTIRPKPSEGQHVSLRSPSASGQPDTIEPMITREIELPHEQVLQAGEGHTFEPDQLAMIRILHNAGSLGLSIPSLLEHASGKLDTLLQTLSELITSSPPLAYILGYDQPRIVSAFTLNDWTVQVPDAGHSQIKLVFPRRWLTIHGELIENIWTMALHAVAGTFVYRPNISEYTLRARYRGLFDRQELNELLTHLLASGKLKRISSSPLPVGMTSLEDETTTYWRLSNDSVWF